MIIQRSVCIAYDGLGIQKTLRFSIDVNVLATVHAVAKTSI